MNKKIIATSGAPAAIGPYSQAVQAGSGTLLFISGQLPADPGTGTLVQGDIGAMTRRCLENIKSILEASGASMANVVKTTVFLTSMEDFAEMNRVYRGYFPAEPPARSTIAVAALPKGAPIEIEAVAVL
ncbi:MAG TPA: RidA family protein [Treponema sp.]|nr:RidA family protein [Treponema sp.]HPC72613.1 RidA family protein [Treponema sp.]HRS04476.1 RidA family protein [Treponema sp.]HRU29165.1 RidA family protein [Treponema sp.]